MKFCELHTCFMCMCSLGLALGARIESISMVKLTISKTLIHMALQVPERLQLEDVCVNVDSVDLFFDDGEPDRAKVADVRCTECEQRPEFTWSIVPE